jgi:hypothetical protein
MRRAVFFATLALTLAVACTYSPKFDDGTLQCSTDHNKCPSGYECHSDFFCYAVVPETGQAGVTGAAGTTGAAGSGGGAGTTGAAGTGGVAGSGGTAGTGGGTPSVNNFPGHWVFQTGSMRSIMCNDGSVDTKSIKDDYVDVFASGGMALVGSYYCDWDLNISTDLRSTSLTLMGQTCTSMSADKTTTFTWHGQTFTFSTSNGSTATLNAKINSNYVITADGKTGTCTVDISGTLKRVGPA